MTVPWNDLATSAPREPLPVDMEPGGWGKRRQQQTEQIELAVERWFLAEDAAGRVKTNNLLICADRQHGAWVMLYGDFDRVFIEAIIEAPAFTLTRSHYNRLKTLDFMWGPEFYEGTAVSAVELDANQPGPGWRLAGRIAATITFEIYWNIDPELVGRKFKLRAEPGS